MQQNNPAPEYTYSDNLVRCTAVNNDGQRCRTLVHVDTRGHVCAWHRDRERRRALDAGEIEVKLCEGVTKTGQACGAKVTVPADSTLPALCSKHEPRKPEAVLAIAEAE